MIPSCLKISCATASGPTRLTGSSGDTSGSPRLCLFDCIRVATTLQSTLIAIPDAEVMRRSHMLVPCARQTNRTRPVIKASRAWLVCRSLGAPDNALTMCWHVVPGTADALYAVLFFDGQPLPWPTVR